MVRQNNKNGDNKKRQDLDINRENGVDQFLTTNQGLRVNDNQNSLKAGERGATLLEDFIMREKITHFDHERIPERIVHARGSGAHGVYAVKFLKDTFASKPVDDKAIIFGRMPVQATSDLSGQSASIEIGPARPPARFRHSGVNPCQ